MAGRDEFAESKNSVARRLRTEGTSAERRQAAENRRKYYGDVEALEQWAEGGFSSGRTIREPGELEALEDEELDVD